VEEIEGSGAKAGEAALLAGASGFPCFFHLPAFKKACRCHLTISSCYRAAPVCKSCLLGVLRSGGLKFEASKQFWRPHLQNDQGKIHWRRAMG
jgi:hypothetical protein